MKRWCKKRGNKKKNEEKKEPRRKRRGMNLLSRVFQCKSDGQGHCHWDGGGDVGKKKPYLNWNCPKEKGASSTLALLGAKSDKPVVRVQERKKGLT